MSGSRFLDDLARTLAEPMPRRRALRLAAGALVGIAVPSALAPAARAASARGLTCGPSSAPGSVDCDCPAPGGLFMKACCSPGEKCVCFPDKAECHRITCPPGREWCGATPCCKPGERCTWDGTRYKCVGPCEDNEFACRKTNALTSAVQCCPKRETFVGLFAKCQAGTCVYKCSPGWEECGLRRCCPENWRCCWGGTHCCAPNETCCGDGCCPRGKFCCDGGGNSTTCCDDDEYCLHSIPAKLKWFDQAVGLPAPVACAPKCNPVNRCGDQCCGRGYKCQRSGPKRGKCVLNLPHRPLP